MASRRDGKAQLWSDVERICIGTTMWNAADIDHLAEHEWDVMMSSVWCNRVVFRSGHPDRGPQSSFAKVILIVGHTFACLAISQVVYVSADCSDCLALQRKTCIVDRPYVRTCVVGAKVIRIQTPRIMLPLRTYRVTYAQQFAV